jgi:hypothetical protein
MTTASPDSWKVIDRALRINRNAFAASFAHRDDLDLEDLGCSFDSNDE